MTVPVVVLPTTLGQDRRLSIHTDYTSDDDDTPESPRRMSLFSEQGSATITEEPIHTKPSLASVKEDARDHTTLSKGFWNPSSQVGGKSSPAPVSLPAPVRLINAPLLTKKSVGAPAVSPGSPHSRASSSFLSEHDHDSPPPISDATYLGQLEEPPQETKEKEGAAHKPIVVDTTMLLQHVAYTVEYYGRDPVLVDPSSRTVRAPVARHQIQQQAEDLNVQAKSARSLPEAPLPLPSPPPPAIAQELPPIRRPAQDKAVVATLRFREREEKFKETVQKELSLAASTSLFATARVLQKANDSKDRATAARATQRKVAEARQEDSMVRDAKEQIQAYRARMVSAQKAQDAELMKTAMEERARSASEATQSAAAAADKRRAMLTQRVQRKESEQKIAATKNRTEKGERQRRLARLREEEAEAAVAHYEAERQQRASERKAVLMFLRYLRVTNMNRCIAEKNSLTRAMQVKYWTSVEENLARVAAARDAKYPCSPEPVLPSASLFSVPGMNVPHEPSLLPGYVYPESQVASLSAAQRYEAWLYALESKWRAIGEFCEAEKCKLDPRNACEYCYQKFRNFTASEIDRSGLSGLAEERPRTVSSPHHTATMHAAEGVRRSSSAFA